MIPFFTPVGLQMRSSRAPEFEPPIETFMCDCEQDGVSVCGVAA